MKEFLETGKIVNIHGLRGDVKILPWSDDAEFICEFDTLYRKSGDVVEIEHSRVSKNVVVMKIKGVDTVEDAQKMRNHILYMDRNDVELEEGSYFVQDLIGLSVVDADNGTVYGKLTDVSETGANDVYHVETTEGKLLLVPAIPEVLVETDIEGETMKIRPLDGLFDL